MVKRSSQGLQISRLRGVCTICGKINGMDSFRPSQTAYRVALRRAVHQTADRPIVFRDPLAVRILGTPAAEMRAPDRLSSKALRAFLVARSAFAEEVLAAAVSHGATQYLLLGAGLDTFAYRNPYPELHVFEVDHPATQAWKLGLLRKSGIAIPATSHHVPVDFEAQLLEVQLRAHGFDGAAVTQCSCLGVVPYLSREGFDATLALLSSLPHGSGLVLDYALPRDLLSPLEQREFDSLAERVRLVGEPFRLFLSPEQMKNRLGCAGFHVTDHLDRTGINQRYFTARNDGLEVRGSGGRLISAVRTGCV